MKKLFSTVLFSILMVFPVVFMSCGDDDDDNKDQGQSNALIGTWMSKDSTEIYEGFYWYEDQYQKFEKDYYYDVYVKQQGQVQTVTVYRYAYSFDGQKITLASFPTFPVSVTVEGDTYKTPTTVFTRVADLPQVALDKIAAGDFEDMDADDEEE
ncbi:MAG: hypothetical protein K6F48_04100 [Paludibacteraceae bacterium]|nr:hypothetical protein [Paludibacteraceae bacterium]